MIEFEEAAERERLDACGDSFDTSQTVVEVP